MTLGSEKGLEKCLGQHGAQYFVHHKHGNVYDFESLVHGAKYTLERQQQQQRSLITHGLPAMGPISESAKFTSNPSVPTNEQHAPAYLTVAPFEILSDLVEAGLPRDSIWNRVSEKKIRRFFE